MGTIIQFPDGLRPLRGIRAGGPSEDAAIIILPSIRVERHTDTSAADGFDPTTNDTTPRPRRRRSR